MAGESGIATALRRVARRLLPRKTAPGPSAQAARNHPGPPATVILINLDRDRERFERVSAELAGANISLTRLSAVLGSSLPRTAVGFIRGANWDSPGTLGCFLSHLRAWETLLEMDCDGIILEDDVKIVRDLAQCQRIALASGADLVFLNHRLALPGGGGTGEETASIEEAVLARAGRSQNAVGTDGYFLTRKGASALVELVRRLGVAGNVDWFILFAMLGKAGLPALAANESFVRNLGHIAKAYGFDAPALSGAVLRRAAVRHVGVDSTRNSENALRRQAR